MQSCGLKRVLDMGPLVTKLLPVNGQSDYKMSATAIPVEAKEEAFVVSTPLLLLTAKARGKTS
jgi:hypothetical protein